MNSNRMMIMTTRVAVLIGFAITLSSWAADSLPATPPAGGKTANPKLGLSSFSSKADIEARLMDVQSESERLMKEESTLKKEMHNADVKMIEFLSTTNAVNDPDIMELKKKLDDAERLVQALRGALQEKLYNLPEYKAQSNLKIAAFNRINTIREQVRGLMGEKMMLKGRLDALNRQNGAEASSQGAGNKVDKPIP